MGSEEKDDLALHGLLVLYKSLLRAYHIGFSVSGGLGARSSIGERVNGGHWLGEGQFL